MNASLFASRAAPSHKAVARMLGYSLHLGDVDAFWGLSVVLRAKLTPRERRGLAWAALRACDDEEVGAVVETVMGSPESAGPPLPPFLDVVDDAAWWAGIALPEEHRAYALAAFLALGPDDRADFLHAARRRVAA